MRVAFDFDGTLSEDLDAWEEVIKTLKSHGHDVYVVTQNWRAHRQDIVEYSERVDVPVFFVQDKSKGDYMAYKGVPLDIVVEDDPASWL